VGLLWKAGLLLGQVPYVDASTLRRRKTLSFLPYK
jgi:hypothetical protein